MPAAGNFYIGSSVNLRSRINNYFQPSYFKNKPDLLIVKAIINDEISNFALVILEFRIKKTYFHEKIIILKL